MPQVPRKRRGHKKAHPCSECRALKKALREERKRHNQTILDHLKLDDYRAQRVIEWIRSGTKPAVLSFTAGNERQIAYAVEDLWMDPADNRLTVKSPNKIPKPPGL